MPSLMVGVLGLGVAAANWPGEQTQAAYPAPASTVPALAAAGSSDLAEPNLRRTASPSPTRTPSAKHKPKAKAKAKAKAAAKPRPSAKPTVRSSAKAAPKPIPLPPLEVIGTRYATASLNVRTAPDVGADIVDVVAPGGKVSVTSATRNGFRFISYANRGRWISDKYLSSRKPAAPSTPKSGGGDGGGISSAACSKSSSIESGLVPNAIKVYRAVCARYPQVSSFGGRRPGDDGFHGTGQAVDVMIADSSVGWAIAKWTRANASALGVSEVIYSQQIWTVERAGDGWRPMADRGSPTANHYDHVHVSVY